MERSIQKLNKFRAFALQIARLSQCKRHKVGCIIIDPWFEGVHALGYNGPARGINNNACTGKIGQCGCAHAEVNALVKLRKRGCVLITTVSPCLACANLILNSGAIIAVVYMANYRNLDGLDLLRRGGIICKYEVTDADIRKWRTLSSTSK